VGNGPGLSRGSSVINWVLNTQKRKKERGGAEIMSHRKKENHMAAWGATFLERESCLLGPGLDVPRVQASPHRLVLPTTTEQSLYRFIAFLSLRVAG